MRISDWSSDVCSFRSQDYPTHAIRLYVPWPPGGGVDTMGRILAEPLSKRLGQSIVVDNRAGAGGNIGTAIAARSEPDGYNLLMGSISHNAVNVHLYSQRSDARRGGKECVS